MGFRACDRQKIKYRKGLWSPEEDQKLRDYVLNHGHGCWSVVADQTGELDLLSPCVLSAGFVLNSIGSILSLLSSAFIIIMSS